MFLLYLVPISSEVRPRRECNESADPSETDPTRYEYDNTILRPIVSAVATQRTRHYTVLVYLEEAEISTDTAHARVYANHHRFIQNYRSLALTNSIVRGTCYIMHLFVTTRFSCHTNAHKTKPKASVSQPMLTTHLSYT